MVKRVRFLLLPLLLLCVCIPSIAADARFDLIGPKIDVRVTRNGQTLPIAAVPNLQPGDKLWIHPDLPASQSVKYLLICAFLRGNTNPPPVTWFHRIETWDPEVREEGAFIVVPPDAQQALLFLAPETGGDFKTLRSAVRGRPGAFVRASQDLIEAGFEEARIEKYIASIRRVPPTDTAELQKHSDLLSLTLALKPNEVCFKQPVDMQFTCLTQTGTQVVLDDGHGKTVADALNGTTADLIAQASYSPAAGGGLYSAYVGAIVDVVRLMSSMHTAQYQYIPAISSPQGDAMNLRLNTPPSFHNPKSVLVIALPSVQPSVAPPLRPAHADEVTCLIKPSVVLPIDGAPLVFSTDFAHDLVLHLNTPPGAPSEPDIPLAPDAYYGGLVLQKSVTHRIPLVDAPDTNSQSASPANAVNQKLKAQKPEPEPVLITGVISGRWGFDAFTGPTVKLQQLPGSNWTILPGSPEDSTNGIIAGHETTLFLNSTGSACVHTITAHPDEDTQLTIPFKRQPKPDQPNLLALTLPLQHDLTPGDLHLAIQQYDQPKADQVSARTFSEPATVTFIKLHAGDRSLVLTGTRLSQIAKVKLGDLAFLPAPDASFDGVSSDPTSPAMLHFALPGNAPAPPTHADENLTATILLRDGRSFSVPLVVASARPIIKMLRISSVPASKSANIILSNPGDLPLSSLLTFTVKSPTPFPRNGQIEIETVDGTLRTVLTLAPSGGLLLQDPHTVVATVDPLRSFGPSAFGALRMRAIYPAPTERRNGHHASEPDAQAEAVAQSNQSIADGPEEDDVSSPASDWLPLVTLVRLPVFNLLQCPSEFADPCTITGQNFFLLQQVSASPDFSNAVAVPDGYTGNTLSVPHISAATIFFKLRDDPSSVDSAILPVPVTHIRPRAKPQPAATSPETKVPETTLPESTPSGGSAPSTTTTPPDSTSTEPGSAAPASPSPSTAPATSTPTAPPSPSPAPSDSPSTAPHRN
jgi:hypothetical protein